MFEPWKACKLGVHFTFIVGDILSQLDKDSKLTLNVLQRQLQANILSLTL